MNVMMIYREVMLILGLGLVSTVLSLVLAALCPVFGLVGNKVPLCTRTVIHKQTAQIPMNAAFLNLN